MLATATVLVARWPGTGAAAADRDAAYVIAYVTLPAGTVIPLVLGFLRRVGHEPH